MSASDVTGQQPLQGLAEEPATPPYHFPTERLRVQQDPNKTPLVLVVCGSFSPITIMHLRLCEMATDWVRQIEEAYEVVGIYLSPVSDAYKKTGLAEARHRVKMCQLAVDDAPGIVMVDSWEATQPEYVPTANVLDRIKEQINVVLGGIADEDGVRRKARVALLAGSDLLQTMSTPGVWSTEDLDRILGGGGMYVVERHGTPLYDARSSLGRWADHISAIHQSIPIDLSSTKVRLLLSRGLSVKYFVPNPVIAYIEENGLYTPQKGSQEKGKQPASDKDKGPTARSLLMGEEELKQR